MKGLFKSTEKIGDIAARFPKAMEIFKEYHIDFCCGGDAPLIHEIEEHNLNEEEVLSRLEEAYENYKATESEVKDWTKAAYGDLIEHVVNTHHAYLAQNLPKLSELTTKILRVHGDHHAELAKVHRLFHSLKMELEQHLIKEEERVFPLIKEFEKNPSLELLNKTVGIINELEDEHEGAGDILKELRKITSNYAVPHDGCRTYELTYLLLEELEGDLFMHIHLENNIMFPRFAEERKRLQ